MIKIINAEFTAASENINYETKYALWILNL